MAPQPNTSVDQIFDTLHLLAATEEAVGVAELARDLGLPTSTAHRLLVTLHDSGFAARDTTGTKYELGLEAHALVQGLFHEFPIQRAALPALRRAADRVGETTALEVRIGWLSVRMVGAEGWHEVHAGTRVGRMCPLGQSAAGLAILAFSAPADVDGYLAWEGDGPPAPARTRALRKTLAAISEAGYAQRKGAATDAAQLAFPVRSEGVGLAAVMLEGSGPAADPSATDLRRCHKIVAELEMLLANQPQLAQHPFAHVDPDELTRMLDGRRVAAT
jgi:DNA-binding IclR family transcriptional regulator